MTFPHVNTALKKSLRLLTISILGHSCLIDYTQHVHLYASRFMSWLRVIKMIKEQTQ